MWVGCLGLYFTFFINPLSRSLSRILYVGSSDPSPNTIAFFTVTLYILLVFTLHKVVILEKGKPITSRFWVTTFSCAVPLIVLNIVHFILNRDNIFRLEAYSPGLLSIFGSVNYFVRVCYVSGVVLAGISEEFIFRGIFQNVLSQYVNVHLANIFISTIFTFIHFALDPRYYLILPWFLISFCCGLAFILTKRISSCLLIHGLQNFQRVIVLFI